MLFLARTVVLTVIAGLTALTCRAAEWPIRPIRIIVPAPAGGPYDRTMRCLLKPMSQQLKQPVFVENRAGAGNIAGTRAGASAAPDGYTFVMTGMLNTIAQSMYVGVPFDIVEDFEHVGAIGQSPQWLLVRSDAGIMSLQDLLNRGRREPGSVTYASSGNGSTGHLLMELLQRSTGVQLVHVPYRGAAPALQDVLSGVVALIAMPPDSALPFVESGQLKVLAISDRQRNPLAPEVPTFAELGFKELTLTSWVGLSAPKGTPSSIVRNVHAALSAALQNPVVQRELSSQGMTALATTPEQYTEMIRDDTTRWGAVVHHLGLKAN